MTQSDTNPLHPTHLDSLELEILHRRDAFSLPAKDIRDALVGIFFEWIAPILPVVNRQEFLRGYYDPEGAVAAAAAADSGGGYGRERERGPSILLLQAMFMVASRFWGNQNQNMNLNQQDVGVGEVTPRAFYKKVKALYDAGYERHPVVIVQAVILLGMYWDGPDDLTECGIFYWSRLGIALAQGYGFHDREKYTNLTASEKGLRKRIWWTLYTRDRSVAVAFGRPLHIDPADCTITPLTERDFIERDEHLQIDYPIDLTHARFFMEYVKLCQLMDLGLCLKLASRSTGEKRVAKAARCELGLNEWLVGCPGELRWRESRHGFLAGVLFSTFYTIVCQLQLLQEPYSSDKSRMSAFHAASTVISILETLHSHRQLQYSPTFMICHAVISFVTLRHQMDPSIPSLLHATRLKLDANLEMLEALSHTWPIAGMMLELFQTIFTPGKFMRLLGAAVEECRQRSRGEADADLDMSWGGRALPFQRPKMKQVILPQSRIVLQLLARTSQNRVPANIPRDVDGSEDEDASYDMSNDMNAEPDELWAGLETDPSAILQNLQEIIRMGRSSYTNHD